MGECESAPLCKAITTDTFRACRLIAKYPWGTQATRLADRLLTGTAGMQKNSHHRNLSEWMETPPKGE